jgi:hypothetical protein
MTGEHIAPRNQENDKMTFSHPSGSIATITPLAMRFAHVQVDFICGSSTVEQFETCLEAILDIQDHGYVAD